MNQLSVRLHGEPVGLLEQNKQGKKQFKYNKNAVLAISVGMPIREKPYDDAQCEAFFGGFLPESEVVKKIIGKRYGVSPNNTFALLKAIGLDCAGAISFQSMEEPVLSPRNVPFEGRVVSELELYGHIKELPQRPLFLDVEGMKLSLAGVQEKAAVCVINNQIAFPVNNCPTTHILKPNLGHFEGLAENEYFMLKVAKKIGLPVPQIDIKKIKDITYLLIERYDRRIKGNFIERIHQEDFCQALAISSSNKYQNEGGPSFKDCFDLLRATATQPVISINLMATILVFNYLIGNMDAHGKNYSLLHQQGNIYLAPFYDLVCTRIYENLTAKMAMKIGGKYNANDVLLRHWQQLSEEIGYRHLALNKLIHSLGNKISNAVVEEKELMASQDMQTLIIDKICYFVERNIEKTFKRLSF